MNVRNRILSVTAGMLLSLGFAAGAKIPFTHASSGAIVTINASKLVVTHQKNGKPETLDFVLTQATSRKGELTVGVLVSVHYRMENNQRFATSIQAQRAKAPERAQSPLRR